MTLVVVVVAVAVAHRYGYGSGVIDTSRVTWSSDIGSNSFHLAFSASSSPSTSFPVLFCFVDLRIRRPQFNPWRSPPHIAR